MKQEFIPNKTKQLQFLHLYGLTEFDDWKDIIIYELYKRISGVVPKWVSFLIQKTGFGYFILDLLEISINSKRDDQNYLIEIKTKDYKFGMYGGKYSETRSIL